MAEPSMGAASAAPARKSGRRSSSSPASGRRRSRPGTSTAGEFRLFGMGIPNPVLWAAGLALLLRVAHVLANRDNPFFHYLPVDSAAYDRWAQRIAGGEWIGNSVFYQDPLYPYFLGVFYKLFGRHLTGLLVLQSVLGSMNVLLLGGIAGQLWNRRAGVVAAFLAAIYAPFVFYDGLVLKTFLEVLLLNAGLLAAILAARRCGWGGGSNGAAAATDIRSARIYALLAGFAFGFGTLARANYLLLAPLVLLWFWMAGRAAGSRVNPLRVGAPPFLAGLASILVIVLLRNGVAAEDWVLTTSQAGQNFYIGNNPENQRGSYTAPSFVRPDPQYEQEDFLREAERRNGRELTPSEASRYWMNEAWSHILANPGMTVKLFVRKLRLYFHRYEIPDNEDINFWGRYSPWLRYNPVRFGLIGPLALVGMVLAWRRRRDVALLHLVFWAYTLSVAAFFLFGRYRLPGVSLLLVFAAIAVVELLAAIRRRDRAASGLVAAALVPALLIVHGPNPEEAGPMSPEMYTNLAMASLQQGRTDEALQYNREAVRLAPSWSEARYNLGITLYRSGRLEEAIAEFAEVVRVMPDHAAGWSYLGNLHEEAGRLEEARAALRRAWEINPESPANLFNLARVEGELGHRTETMELLARLYAMNDPQFSVDGRLIEARLLAQTGDRTAAAAVLRDYLRKRPESPMRSQLEASIREWEAP